jgi:hypothetical protein
MWSVITVKKDLALLFWEKCSDQMAHAMMAVCILRNLASTSVCLSFTSKIGILKLSVSVESFKHSHYDREITISRHFF